MGEYIEHHGKGPPELSPTTHVDVKFRDGFTDKGFSVSWYGPWGGTRDHWTHEGNDKDIVSYLVKE